jgi:hypothetical protein
LQLNRKYLVFIASALLVANAAFLYVKTRPQKPAVIMEASPMWVRSDEPESKWDAVHIDKEGQWRTQEGNRANLALITPLTIPNSDSPSYWIYVEQQERWTLAHVLATIRAAAKEGICNLVVVDREMAGQINPNDNQLDLPVLTVAEYSKEAGGALQPCVADPRIAQRYEVAQQEYRRSRRKLIDKPTSHF